MRFNIIYTPGTFRKFYLFLMSLLEKTTLDYCLVANGCLSKELALMQRSVDAHHERLSLINYSEGDMHPHYHVLDALQAQTNETYFAFMDSDIMALGNFEDRLNSELTGSQAVFSGRPIWSPDAIRPEGRKKAGGRFMLDRDGFCLGGTYFACYDNAVLNNLRRQEGIGFGFKWWQELSVRHQEKIDAMGRRFERFDNGKVINLLLQANGSSCRYMESDEICHFGGMSRFASVLTKDDERMRWHEKHRSGQKDMRLIAGFMSSAIDSILDFRAVAIPSEIRNHFAFGTIEKALNTLEEVRDKYSLSALN